MASVDSNFSDFIGCLKSSFDQSVVWHHQTDSYAVHKALNKFYDGILGLTDGLVESVSGIHGRPKDYEIDEPINYKNPEQVINYFKSFYDSVQKDRKDIYEETWVQNQIDEIAQLLAKTLYLLSLK
jgi:hypothetical protein